MRPLHQEIEEIIGNVIRWLVGLVKRKRPP